jgi:hypothetical protein
LAQADIATRALANDTGHEEAFYRGKIATAGFFVKNMLPQLTSLRGVIEAIDDEIMNVAEEAF